MSDEKKRISQFYNDYEIINFTDPNELTALISFITLNDIDHLIFHESTSSPLPVSYCYSARFSHLNLEISFDFHRSSSTSSFGLSSQHFLFQDHSS